MGSRKPNIFIFLFELILIVIVFAAFARNREEITFDQSALTKNIDEATMCESLLSSDFLLRRGIYEVTVWYNATGAADQIGTTTMEFLDGDSVSCRVDTVPVFGYQSLVSYDSYVYKSAVMGRINNLFITDTEVSGISIRYENIRTAAYLSLCVLLFFAFVDGISFVAFKWKAWSFEKKIVFLAVALTSIFAFGPMMMSNLPIGHDINFHLMRISSIAEGLKEGQFPVRMQDDWLNGYGYPLGICYGDILLYFPGILYLIGVPLAHAYKIYVFLITFLTVIISYKVFAKMSDDYRIGIVSMLLYVLGNWRLVDVYSRAALGEYSAIAFFPLIIYAFWLLMRDVVDIPKTILLFVLGATGLIQTHIISVYLAVIFAVLFCLVEIRKLLQCRRIIVLLGAVLSVLLVNAGFLIPFFDYYINEPLEIKSGGIKFIQGYGVEVFDFYKFLTENVVNEIPLNMGVALTIVLAGIIIWRLLIGYKNNREVMIPTLFAVLAMFMTTKYFPYDWLSIHFPMLFGSFRIIQFPWRMFVVSTFFTVTAFSVAMKDIKMTRKDLLNKVGITVCSVAAIQALLFFNLFAMVEKTDYNPIGAGGLDKYLSVTEYTLEMSDIEKTKSIPIVMGEDGIDIKSESRKGFNFTIDIENKSGDEADITLPVFGYKGFRASGGGEEFDVDYGGNNFLTVSIPEGFSGIVEVGFKEAWYWRLAEVISLISVITIIAYYLNRLKKQSEG